MSERYQPTRKLLIDSMIKRVDQDSIQRRLAARTCCRDASQSPPRIGQHLPPHGRSQSHERSPDKHRTVTQALRIEKSPILDYPSHFALLRQIMADVRSAERGVGIVEPDIAPARDKGKGKAVEPKAHSPFIGFAAGICSG